MNGVTLNLPQIDGHVKPVTIGPKRVTIHILGMKVITKAETKQ